MTDDRTLPQTVSDSLALPGPDGSFRLRYEMLSDWHVGSGTGRPGNIDRLVQRDADGLPYLPAKTITGIWRDAAEQLAYALDEGGKDGGNQDKGGKHDHWSRLVELLFGNQPALPGAAPEKRPHHSLVQTDSAHYSRGLREWIRKKIAEQSASDGEPDRLSVKQQLERQLYAASTIIKPGVRIDEATGQAKTDFLRFVEMGRKGAVLEAGCQVDLERLRFELREAARALLLACTKLIERVGGKRRRGGGLCRVELSDGGPAGALENAIAWLEAHAGELDITGDDHESPGLRGKGDAALDLEAQAGGPEAGGGEWFVVPLVLKLKKPLAVTARTLGNVSKTLDYLPGTYLLPHVTRALGKGVGYDCRAAIARGDLQVLPATIEVRRKAGGEGGEGSTERGLPVPLALFHLKSDSGFDKQGSVFNRFRERGGDEQLKGYREGYVGGHDFDPSSNRGRLPAYVKTPKVLGTHNTIQDDVQRPTEEVGGVYSWEAIEAGVTLRSELHLRGNVKEAVERAAESKGIGEWWGELACEDLRLGSASRGDYGSVSIAAEVEGGDAGSVRAGGPLGADGRLTVWLLSDVLLRETTMRPTTFVERLREVLAKELKRNEQEGGPEIELKLWQPPREGSVGRAQGEGLLGLQVRARRVESWQVGWGFPRPSLLALQAGSCVVFELGNGEEQPLEEGQRARLERELRRVEREGIGERRAEGYGQVRFNDPLVSRPLKGWEPSAGPDEQQPDAPEGAALTGEDKEVAKQLEEAAWRDELRRAILATAGEPERRTKILGVRRDNEGRWSPSFSQLGALREAFSRLREETDRPTMQGWLKRLGDTRNEEKRRGWESALKEVRRLVDEPEHVWGVLNWQAAVLLTLTEGGEARLKNLLWADAVRGLVDACIRAHRRESD